ncbi:MAG: hypothetical protein ACLPN5_21580 [Roseiarcus sp.]
MSIDEMAIEREDATAEQARKTGVTKTTSQRFEIAETVDRNDHPPEYGGDAFERARLRQRAR